MVNTKPPPQSRAQQDQFYINIRAGEAIDLDADLAELPLPALLRPFVAKHCALIPQTLRLHMQKAVL